MSELDTADSGAKLCPKCGLPGSGPHARRVGRGNSCGFYYKHNTVEGGERKTVWHYIPKDNVGRRRARLIRLVATEGWKGIGFYVRLFKVSRSTIRRDIDALRIQGRIIHKPWGGYIADPSGTLLKEKPWIAWS